MLLLSIPLTATAQQNKPWESELCKDYIGSCGILVTFNPPIKDVLLVPNEVTVDVPLELGKVSKVVVSSYPLGTGVADIPSEGFVAMYHFQKVGKYARFRGEIKQCTDQGSLTVDVFFKGFERYPMSAGVGGLSSASRAAQQIRNALPVNVADFHWDVKAKVNASFRPVKLGASTRVAAAVATVAQSIFFVELAPGPSTHRLLQMQWDRVRDLAPRNQAAEKLD
jgi:hypothetical protein